MGQKGSIVLPIIIVVLILTVLTLIGVFSGFRTSPKDESKTAALPVPAQSPALSKYPKKLFINEKGYFRDKPYPEDLLHMSEETLVGIRCNRLYKKEGEAYKPDPEMAEIGELGNIQMEIVNKINSLNPDSQIHAFALCQDELSRYHLLYGSQASKANSYPISPKLAYLDNNLEILQNIDLPFKGYYGGCYKALQLTEENHLYLQCNDGDGQYVIASIYNLDLDSGEAILNASCNSKPAESGEESDVTGSRVVCSSTN